MVQLLKTPNFQSSVSTGKDKLAKRVHLMEMSIKKRKQEIQNLNTTSSSGKPGLYDPSAEETSEIMKILVQIKKEIGQFTESSIKKGSPST